MRRLSRPLRGTLATALLLTGALFLSACTGADARSTDQNTATSDLPKETADALRDAVKKAMAVSGSSGALAGVWAPWSGNWIGAPGESKAKGGVPMSADMHFRVGSLTKPMTCTVLLRLVDDGKVGLDDPVSDYLPRVVGTGDITLGQLCQNTSGLADYSIGIRAQMVNTPARPWVPMELISDALAQPRVDSPGAKWSYSEPGFVLLGMALENATGSSWSQLYSKYVFEPLGLSQTSFPTQATTLPSPAPDGYATALDPATGAPQCGSVIDESKHSPSATWTTGGVVSTVGDLGVFAKALATGSLLSEKTRAAQVRSVGLPVPDSSWQRYGLGEVQLGPLRGHDGQTPGFITAMLSDPGSGLTVVVMLNNSTSPGSFAQALAMQLASIAAKAPATAGHKAPSIALPWSAEQAAASLAALAVCPPEGTVPAPADGAAAPKAQAPLPTG